ncbi:polysaccharide deacetylase family protein [Marinobacter sp.]|uniref:polysaccharide deacetylase family protein n=1 Tax=Marinobacter sp. TaxID=50741 RepID=UPI0035661F2E
MYHRILPTSVHGAITVSEFKEQLDIISKHFRVMTLKELITANDKGDRTDNVVVLTFDDGYYDFYQYAFPILKERGLSATLFITTGFVDKNLWLWPDQLMYCLKNSKKNKVFVEALGKQYYLPEETIKCWHDIANLCLSLDEELKNATVNRVFENTGVTKLVNPPNEYSAVTWEQLAEMVDDGLEVGSHSHTHPILTRVGSGQLKNELIRPISLIKRKLGLEDIGFCYPNGESGDFNELVKKEVQSAGYIYGISAFPGLKPISDRWELNRYPANKNKNLFEKNIFGLTYLRLKLKSAIFDLE